MWDIGQQSGHCYTWFVGSLRYRDGRRVTAFDPLAGIACYPTFLSSHVLAYVSKNDVLSLLVHDYNQVVAAVIKSMVSSSPMLMSELRNMRAMFHGLKILIDALCLPSNVNRHADSSSRTWDPGEIHT